MPLDDPTLNEPADAPAAAPAAAPPAVDLTGYVSRDDYLRMEGQLAQMGAQLQQLAGGQARAVAPDPGPVYSDEQLAEMLESGEGRKVLEANRYITRQTVAPLAGEFVSFRENTMHTAAGINRELAETRGRLPHANDPAVKRSMDEFLSALPAGAQANPQAIELAHAHAVARPENFKRLVDQQVEAELRRRAGGDEPIGSGTGAQAGARVPSGAGGDIPTIRELLGDDAANAVRSKGQTADQFTFRATRGKFKKWGEYAKHIQGQQAEESASGDDFEDRNIG